MNMTRKHFVVCATVLAFVWFAAVTVSAQNALRFESVRADLRIPVEAKVVKGAPFSAEIINESIQTLGDGNRIVHQSKARIYRDGEGRVRREEERGSGAPTISITDPVTGLSFTLDPESRVAWQTPGMAAVRFTGSLQPGTAVEKLEAMQRKLEVEVIGPGPIETAVAEQVKVEQLPARDIEGVRAEGTRRTTTIAAGAIGNELPIEIVSEEWTSPDLKILVMTERRDPRLGTSTYRLVNIIRAEPDHYLFEVPSDYTLKETGMIRRPGPGPKK